MRGGGTHPFPERPPGEALARCVPGKVLKPRPSRRPRRTAAIASAALLLVALSSAAPAGTEARAAPQAAASESYDLLILGGRIVDGTGNPWFRGDVAIRDGRIVGIAPRGLLAGATATETIDAAGMVVAPGFIDIQGQSRSQFLSGDGRVVSKITQGITTEILGEGTTDYPGRDFRGTHGFDEWLRAMHEHGTSPNVGSFLGASSVRRWVKGEAQGAPDAAELDQMRALVRNAMRDGAFGVASALIYPPGNFATTEELIAMATAMSPYGGVYITHMRSEADMLLEALDEAIRIGSEGGVPVEVYHLKAAGTRNWPKAAEAVSRIEAARAAGLDVSADMYPYTAGSTGLTACLPPSASADGKLFENLADPATRAAIRAEILDQKTEWENLCALSGPDKVLIARFNKEENRRYAGMYLAEIAAAMGEDWVDALIDLIVSEQGDPGTIYFMMSEDNVRMQLALPWIKFGTDAGGADPERSGALTHPRAYGTFPRILGRYVREEGVMPLEEAVRKMTSSVAQRLSLRDRGLLREGFFADVVVFDPATVIDRATYEEPHQVAAGIPWVLVNGTVVVRNGVPTGALPGRIVRGPGYQAAESSEQR